MDDRVLQVANITERALFAGDAGGLAEADGHLDAVEAELLLARAKVLHARFATGGPADPAELELLLRAAALHRGLGSLPGGDLPPGGARGRRGGGAARGGDTLMRSYVALGEGRPADAEALAAEACAPASATGAASILTQAEEARAAAGRR